MGLMSSQSDESMTSAPPSRRSTRSRLIAAALVACANALLAGCSGALIGETLPAAVGGLPEDAPARPATPTAYPAVHSMPPSRSSAPLSADQQKQLEDDLVAARSRYGGNPDAPAATGTTANAKAGSAQNP
jgi:hypothetical protein